MKALVVDDEWAAVDVMRTGVDWLSIGFAEVEEAYSMASAVEKFKQSVSIDLVLCDIEMPNGSGLELAEWIRQHSPETIVIFLTCHDQFTFVQKALQLGGFNYLLKPIDFEEITSILKQAATLIHQRQQLKMNQEHLEKHYQLWSDKKDILMEKFWQDLLDGRITGGKQAIIREMMRYYPPYDGEFEVLPILISVERWHEEFNQMDEEILEYALRNAANELIVHENPGIVFQDHAGMNLILIYVPEGNSISIAMLKEVCERYSRQVAAYFYCDLSCYIGRKSSIEDTVHIYNELRVQEQDNISKLTQVLALKSSLHAENHLSLPNFFEWADRIHNGEMVDLNKEVRHVFQQLRASGATEHAVVLPFKQGIIQSFSFLLKMKGIAPEQGMDDLSLQPCTIAELEQWTYVAIARTEEHLRCHEQEETVVERVKRIIRETLGEELTREGLAAAVHMNPGYLSRMFKKETGYTLTDYITNERMQRAAELLKTNATITEISMAVGYSYQSHFSKMFKREYQISPQEYRKLKKY